MKAEIISVGTELLLGEIVDTNASYISRRLASIGVDVFFRHTVGDNLGRMVQTLRQARRRADLLILSGGLGPTPDDLTREALAELTQRPLVAVPEAELTMHRWFMERGRTPTPSNFKQCQVPRGGELLDNPVGTAPGLWVQHEQNIFIAVPGPPPEMHEMIEGQVLPRLRLRLQSEGAGVLWTRTLRLAGVGESQIADDLADLLAQQKNPSLALYASPGEVRVRLATKTTNELVAAQTFAPVEGEIRKRLGAAVYGVDDETMEVAVGQALLAAGATLAVAESCTGGIIASRITDVPGASRYFKAGYVTYSNEAKRDMLRVPAEVLVNYGAVSEECCRAMAVGARERAGADYAAAVTGIAGPGGGTAEKPMGLVFVGIADRDGCEVERQLWPSSREQFKQRVSQMTLDMVRKRIISH